MALAYHCGVDRANEAVASGAIWAAIGMFAGFVLALTLMPPPAGVAPTSACGPSELIRDAGLDPWTGEAHGRVIQGRCMDHEYVTEDPVPDELRGRTGLPWASLLVAGFGVGGLAVGSIVGASTCRPQPFGPRPRVRDTRPISRG